MKTAEWLARELSASNQTAFAFFSVCYYDVYRHPCRSNQIVLDANRYQASKAIPPYVFRFHEKLQDGTRALPERTARLYSMLGLRLEVCRLVDPDPIVIHARRGRDGVWRC